ncbi:MAG: nucleotidyltransferase family protein [Proteobacteria bacterium]|nr:nucleotidyltransferase family protein [Pseudomonadota bacterium]
MCDPSPSRPRWTRVGVELLVGSQLAEVLCALSAQEVNALLLKGTAFWTSIYEPGERKVTDIDLLVHPDEQERSVAALQGLGYRIRPPPGRPATARQFYERTFLSGAAARPVPVEIHTNLIHPVRYRIDLEGLFARAQTSELSGQPVRRLCAEDSLLHLALHRTVHGHGLDADLRNIEDAHRLIRAFPIRWDVLSGRARSWGCCIALWLLLTSARQRFSSPVPEATLAGLSPRTLRRRYVRRVTASHEGVLQFRWPGLAPWRRRLLLFPIVLDSPRQHLASLLHFARLRALDVLESRFAETQRDR